LVGLETVRETRLEAWRRVIGQEDEALEISATLVPVRLLITKKAKNNSISGDGLKGRQLKKQKTVMQQAEQVKYNSCGKGALVGNQTYTN